MGTNGEIVLHWFQNCKAPDCRTILEQDNSKKVQNMAKKTKTEILPYFWKCLPKLALNCPASKFHIILDSALQNISVGTKKMGKINAKNIFFWEVFYLLISLAKTKLHYFFNGDRHTSKTVLKSLDHSW